MDRSGLRSAKSLKSLELCQRDLMHCPQTMAGLRIAQIAGLTPSSTSFLIITLPPEDRRKSIVVHSQVMNSNRRRLNAVCDSAMPLDVRKRSALPFRFIMNSGPRPQQVGHSPKFKWGLAGRPKAFRTSGGVAEDFLGKAASLRLRLLALNPSG